MDSVSTRFYWKLDGPIPVHRRGKDGHEWVWTFRNDAGDLHTFACEVTGDVGDGSAEVALAALYSQADSEASKAAMMRHPPDRVVLDANGYVESACVWNGGERPAGHPDYHQAAV